MTTFKPASTKVLKSSGNDNNAIICGGIYTYFHTAKSDSNWGCTRLEALSVPGYNLITTVEVPAYKVTENTGNSWL